MTTTARQIESHMSTGMDHSTATRFERDRVNLLTRLTLTRSEILSSNMSK
jgi:hypothetical protein